MTARLDLGHMTPPTPSLTSAANLAALEQVAAWRLLLANLDGINASSPAAAEAVRRVIVADVAKWFGGDA